jgi:hypothetical protein
MQVLQYRHLPLIAVLLFILTGCHSDSDSASRRFVFGMDSDAGGEQDFVAITSDPVVIAKVLEELDKPVEQRNLFIIGPIDRGNPGGHNLNWNWHFKADQWDLTELAIELCDGNAVLVEQAIDYWVDTVGQFCPWNSYVKLELD